MQSSVLCLERGHVILMFHILIAIMLVFGFMSACVAFPKMITSFLTSVKDSL